MEVLHERCAGLDIHKEVIFVCLLLGLGRRSQKIKRKFGTFPNDLVELRQWLLQMEVTHVLMESTGVYWMPVYDALEGELQLVVGNAQHIMNVPGRKTDESDAQWLAKLLRFGLINPSFVPAREFRQLRQLTRYRRATVQARASEQNRIEKHLQIAGIKLSSVSSKVFTVSGADMMRHIADGQTDPNKLADLARARMRHKIPALQKVFAVSVSEHVRRLLDVHLRHMDRLDCTIAEIELQIEQKTQIYGDHISQLDAIPGVDVRAAIDILAEIGTVMSPWKTHRQIAAMAGVCPGNYISAGKRLKNRSRQGNPYLKSVLVQVATSAINTKDSYYQAKYIRLKQRRGHKRAVVAIAHAILVAIYYMLKRAEPYRELGAAFTAEELHAKRKTTLLKQLQKLGYQVTLTPVHQTA